MSNITSSFGSIVGTTGSAQPSYGSSANFATQMQPQMQNYEIMTATQRTFEFLGRKVDKLVTWWYSSPQPTLTRPIAIQDYSEKQKARFDDRLHQAIDNRMRLELAPFTPEEKVVEKERIDAILKERLLHKRFIHLLKLIEPVKYWVPDSEVALIPLPSSKTELPLAKIQPRIPETVPSQVASEPKPSRINQRCF